MFTNLGWTRITKLTKDTPLIGLYHIDEVQKNAIYVPTVVMSRLDTRNLLYKDSLWCLLKNHPNIPQSWVIYDTIKMNHAPICELTKSYYNLETIKKSNSIIPFTTDTSYIIKPLHGARQRDMFVVTSKPDLVQKVKYIFNTKKYIGAIVSKYISNPYLISGKKHHLRMHFIPAIINGQMYTFLCKLGYVITASEDYDHENITHLKGALSGWSNYKYAEVPLFFPDAYGPYAGKVMKQIKQILTDVSEAIDGKLTTYPDSLNGYNIYGVDIMVDSDMKVWLLEINRIPDMYYYPVWGDVALMTGIIDNILRKIFVLPKIKRDNYFVQLYGP